MTFSTEHPSFFEREKDRLYFNDKPIHRRGRMFNLTDMHRAAGEAATDSNRPVFWLRLPETVRFRKFLRWRYKDEAPSDVDPNRALHPAFESEADGLVTTARGNKGGTWAHWQLALSYARYLSPAFAAWGNTVIKTVMEELGVPSSPDEIMNYLETQFGNIERELGKLNRMVKCIDRHAADHMLLQLASQDILTGERRPFGETAKGLMCEVIRSEEYEGACPCCHKHQVLDADGPVTGAEFDHFFHRGLNKATHGWLICAECHGELTHGGYLNRFFHMEQFRAFQHRVHDAERARFLERRRRVAAAKATDPDAKFPPNPED